MSYLDTMRKEKMQAMKDKDAVKGGICGLLIAAMILKEKDTKLPVSNEDALAIIQKELKQTKETLAMTPADRMDSIAETTQKVAILESYLPKQMSDAELDAMMQTILAQLQLEATVKNKGMLIKEAMARAKGTSDGKAINAAVARILQ